MLLPPFQDAFSDVLRRFTGHVATSDIGPDAFSISRGKNLAVMLEIEILRDDRNLFLAKDIIMDILRMNLPYNIRLQPQVVSALVCE